MKKFWTYAAVWTVALAIVAGLIWGGYVFKRWVNWKFSYESKVEERVVPLEWRVKILDRRVEILERNYKTDVLAICSAAVIMTFMVCIFSALADLRHARVRRG